MARAAGPAAMAVLLMCMCTWLLAQPAAASERQQDHLDRRHMQQRDDTHNTQPPGAYSSQVDRVLASALQLARVSRSHATALVQALGTGSLDAAKAAYIKARPEYEQVEHLFAGFPDVDRDIDARPDAFEYGESYPRTLQSPPQIDGIFKGAHRIETLLFREGDAGAALPWAHQLVSSHDALIAALQARGSYTAASVWAGAIAVAEEVGKKKFSSEEETWSDQSILIFWNNLQGVKNIAQPWQQSHARALAPVTAALQRATDALQYYLRPIGGGTNEYTPYSRVNIGARSAIQAAFYAISQSMTKAAVDLGISLKSDEEEEEECEPNVTATVYNGTSGVVGEGIRYFKALMPYQRRAAADFTRIVQRGDLAAAKAAYPGLRVFYEQIEVLAPSFPDIDSDLDAREYSFDGGEWSPSFKGFHRLERHIFRDGLVDAQTLGYARGLEASLQQLDAALNTPALFDSARSFEGLLGVANEVPSKKISSEEETSSDLSLLIFYNNWKGIYSQAAPFFSLAGSSDVEAFRSAVQAAVACLQLRTQDNVTASHSSDITDASVATLMKTDYKQYSSATIEQRRCIVRQGYAVRDTLARLANAARLLDDCSPYHSSKWPAPAASG